MISVTILGTGNVAKHLFDAFMVQPNIEIVQVYGRNEDKLAYFAKHVNTCTDISKIEETNVHIIAISDDAIKEVSKSLAGKKGLIVHTSGSRSIKTLPKKNRRGVFYPLQTFSPKRKVDFKEIPICIEAENKSDYELLNNLATEISGRVFHIDSNQRKTLHLAAVFANNFTNHIYHSAQEICSQNNVAFDLLLPLIKETVAKVESLSPYEAQTGPARRNDEGTIKKQKKQLKEKKHKRIYSLLSKSIKQTYGKEL